MDDFLPARREPRCFRAETVGTQLACNYCTASGEAQRARGEHDQRDDDFDERIAVLPRYPHAVIIRTGGPRAVPDRTRTKRKVRKKKTERLSTLRFL